MWGAPTLNRGTAFTAAQREALGLTGLLRTGVSNLDEQLRRVYAQYCQPATNLHKWVYLTTLRGGNEVLFYRLLTEHLSEMLPVVYTPTVEPRPSHSPAISSHGPTVGCSPPPGAP